MRKAFPIVVALWAMALPAFAQPLAPLAVVAPPAPFQLDLTQIIVAAIGVVGSTILGVATYLINRYVTDAAAKAEFNTQLKQSLGALQQSAEGVVVAADPTITLPPGIPAGLQPAAQFMLDHAGTSIKELGITGPMLASHIVAEIGLQNIKANIAVATAAGAVVAPLVVAPRLVAAEPLASPLLAPNKA